MLFYIDFVHSVLCTHTVGPTSLTTHNHFPGIWGIGLARGNCDLDQVPLGDLDDSWTLRQDGNVYHNGQVVAKVNPIPEEGDVVVGIH